MEIMMTETAALPTSAITGTLRHHPWGSAIHGGTRHLDLKPKKASRTSVKPISNMGKDQRKQ
jgi:hypothetical protein